MLGQEDQKDSCSQGVPGLGAHSPVLPGVSAPAAPSVVLEMPPDLNGPAGWGPPHYSRGNPQGGAKALGLQLPCSRVAF